MEGSMKDEIALKVEQLSVNYDKTPVLWDISLEIPKGKLIGIIGPNGAGKSTFIKTALGLLKPISGKIEFFSKPLKDVRKKIAYVPQRESVDWDFPITVRDLVLMGRYGKLGIFSRPKKADIEATEYYLEMVGMQGFADRQISQLSGGQQQRIFIARALLQEAEIYFLDEPFSGIDLASEKVIIEILKKLRNQGKTVFVVHHDLNTVEKYFDWIILINMRLIGCGATHDFFTSELLNVTYGKNFALFDEAVKLSQQIGKGMNNK